MGGKKRKKFTHPQNYDEKTNIKRKNLKSSQRVNILDIHQNIHTDIHTRRHIPAHTYRYLTNIHT